MITLERHRHNPEPTLIPETGGGGLPPAGNDSAREATPPEPQPPYQVRAEIEPGVIITAYGWSEQEAAAAMSNILEDL